ncbi:hypothetical protein D8T52_17595 [Vibrio vulnificus]|nr:hypothetical protein D8T52_17595 [Vibrio vulnificus]
MVLVVFLVHIAMTDKVGQGTIVLLSILPLLVCAYCWSLMSNPPYRWLREYRSKHINDVNAFFETWVKLALVLFPTLYLLLGSSLVQHGYQRVDVERHALGGDSFYYKKTPLPAKSQQGKLKCAYKEQQDGRQILACEEVFDDRE